MAAATDPPGRLWRPTIPYIKPERRRRFTPTPLCCYRASLADVWFVRHPGCTARLRNYARTVTDHALLRERKRAWGTCRVTLDSKERKLCISFQVTEGVCPIVRISLFPQANQGEYLAPYILLRYAFVVNEDHPSVIAAIRGPLHH